MDDFVLFAGGSNDDDFSNLIDVFVLGDAGPERYTHELTLFVARYRLAGATVDDYVLFAGGSNASGCKKTIDVFKLDGGSLKKVGDHGLELSEARDSLAGAAVGNYVLFAGGNGEVDDISYKKTIDVFKLEKDELVSEGDMGLSLTEPMTNCLATTIGNNVIIGGYTDDKYHYDVFRLQDDTIKHVEHIQSELKATTDQRAVAALGPYSLFTSYEKKIDCVWLNAPGYRGQINSGTFGVTSGNALLNNFEYYKPDDKKIQNPLFNSTGEKTDAYNVINQIGPISMAADKEAYLIRPVKIPDEEYQENAHQEAYQTPPLDRVTYIENPYLQCSSFAALPDLEEDDVKFAAARLSTHVVKQLQKRLIGSGLDALLSPDSQQLKEPDFNRLEPAECVIGRPSETLDFDGPFGIYFRELFFHVPFLIAKTLQNNRQHREAQQWYHYIFDPTNKDKEYWRYLPFREEEQLSISKILTDEAAIKAYNDEPFSPHAIARLRTNAYQKAVVMSYIDNMLDWGDLCFARDDWESITEATMLYFVAYGVMGPVPENVGRWPIPGPLDFNAIKEATEEIPQFLIELENAKGFSGTNLVPSGREAPINHVDAYFGVVDNKDLAGYWEKVEDRLFKIRHSMNIEGVFRVLALFEPPIDPAALVKAAAGGLTPMQALDLIHAELLPYRFDYILEKAKSLCSTVVQLGGALLSALEKQDAEAISVMRSVHEKAVLKLVETTKKNQIEEAKASLDAIKESLKSAEIRKDHYNIWIEGGLIAGEIAADLAHITAKGLLISRAAPQSIAGTMDMAPNTFGMANGGHKWSGVIEAGSNVIKNTSTIFDMGGDLLSKTAGYARRAIDWKFQRDLAEQEIQQINKQIEAQKLRVTMAEHELKVHRQSVKNAGEIEAFLEGKFSNKALYQWMVSRISTVYFQSFTLARDTALAAQRAYQFELNKDDGYIALDYWDDLKKGLMAGEGLMLGIGHLEQAFIAANKRSLEIEKIISLDKQWPDMKIDDGEMPGIIQRLKSDKMIEFELDHRMFAENFPGHYNRKIKSISITIPAVVGPYQNINATLSQLNNSVILKPDKEAVEYLDDPVDKDAPSSLRQDWRSNQGIAISKALDDAGVFELNFRDERYLPFEGTGVNSKWRLELSGQGDAFEEMTATITDVIVKVNYTALHGGGGFETEVKQHYGW
ncbi:MAG: hypothetical protein GY757_23310 [bacterium]|nr:hypothetical protein [bacterium]